jgi:hypothetical protein
VPHGAKCASPRSSRCSGYSDLFSLQQLTHGLAYMIGDVGGSFVVT